MLLKQGVLVFNSCCVLGVLPSWDAPAIYDISKAIVVKNSGCIQTLIREFICSKWSQT